VSTAGTSRGYDSLFGSFGLRENPFNASPDPRFLFSGPAYQTAIAELMFGIESRRGLHVLTGEAGTGKTTLMRYFLQWLNGRHFSSSYVFHSHLAPAELFEFILRDFGAPVDSTKKTDLLATLQQWLLARQAAGDTPVLIIDEAQALSLRTLSQLRLLLNLENSSGKLLQVILAGQSELVEKLHSPELTALRQRMTVHCRLPLLTLEDTAEYINVRLRGAGAADPQIFSSETVQTLYSYARGIPRVTNLLCERAMMDAYAGRQSSVSSANVRNVAAEYDLEGETGPCPTIDLALPRREPEPLTVAKATPVVRPAANIASPVIAASAPATVPAVLATPAAPAPASTITNASAPEPVVAFVLPSASIPQTSKPPKPKDKHPKEFIVEFRLASAEDQESPKIVDGFDWRKYRAENPFRGYWSEVSRNFRRDARQLYLSVAPNVRSLARRIRLPHVDVRRLYVSVAPRVTSFARNLQQPKPGLRRKLFEPLTNWLRTPINPGRTRQSGTSAPPARTGKS
jgi:general secretion pathway protein A